MRSRKVKVKNQTGLKIKQVYILLFFSPSLIGEGGRRPGEVF
jgi:hypothetical protein